MSETNSTLSFKLEIFEGPLDLLLHLIAKHKLNINDIQITILVEQYLEYINMLSEEDYELAGEFLEMAARLIYIKTVSLLPKQDEAEVLKKELEGRLIEYSLCKIAAKNMRDIYIGDVFATREPMKLQVDTTYEIIHDAQVLRNAYLNISVADTEEDIDKSRKTIAPIISKKIVAVSSKIIYLLRRLYAEGSCMMNELFSSITDKSERVATFLAVLELTRSGRIMLNDDNTEITFNRNKIIRDDTAGEVVAE